MVIKRFLFSGICILNASMAFATSYTLLTGQDYYLSELLAGGYTELRIDGANLFLDTLPFPTDVLLRLDGDANLYINASELSSEYKIIVPNTMGGGVISLHVPDLPDTMYIDQKMDGGQYIARLVANDDYAVIFTDKRGQLLANLYNKNPNDKLFARLRGRTDFANLGSVLNKSARFNPIKMMWPVQNIDMFEINARPDAIGINATPMYIYSDDFDSYGARASAGFHLIDKMDISATMYAMRLNFSDDFDEFKSTIYGGNIGFAYDDKLMVVRGRSGMTYATFDIGDVLSRDTIKHNPDGYSAYATVDAGVYINIAESVNFIPFIGGRFNTISIAGDSENAFNGFAGTDIGYESNIDNLGYSYSLRMTVDTDKNIYGGISTGFWSEYDGIGGNAQVGIVHSDEYTSWRFALNVKIEF